MNDLKYLLSEFHIIMTWNEHLLTPKKFNTLLRTLKTFNTTISKQKSSTAFLQHWISTTFSVEIYDGDSKDFKQKHLLTPKSFNTHKMTLKSFKTTISKQTSSRWISATIAVKIYHGDYHLKVVVLNFFLLLFLPR